MKKNMLIMFFIFALLICQFVWWFDIGSWCSLPIELCYTHASDFSFRDKNNNKAEADMYTWRTFFHPDDFVSSEEKLIYNQYNSLVGFDFSQYTYILSYGFSIEYLYCKQPDAKKMQYVKSFMMSIVFRMRFCYIAFREYISSLIRIAPIVFLTNLFILLLELLLHLFIIPLFRPFGCSFFVRDCLNLCL